MHNTNPLLFLFTKIKWPKKLIFFTMIISSLGSISGLLIPLFTGNLVDNFSLKNLNFLYILSFILIFIGNAVFSGLGLYMLNKIGSKVIYDIRSLLWKHMINLEISFFDKNESGQLMSRLTDDTQVINFFISMKLPNLVPAVLSVLGSILILFIMDWKMTLVIFLIIPLYIAIILPLGKMMQKVAVKTQTETAIFSGLLGRVLNEIRLVKISNTQNKELNKANRNLKSIYFLSLQQGKISAIIQPISSILMLLTVGVILGFGGMRVSSGEMSAGTLVAMIFYIFQLSMPLMNLSTLVTDYKRAVGASHRIYEILNEPIEKSESKHINMPINGKIVFNNVSFSYKNNWVLHEINAIFNKNEVTAIVGPSGSGKTTIFNLIEKLYPLKHGDILYNDKSIVDYSLYEWREKIGYVMQNNSMMNGTIRENIEYGSPEKISDDKIIKSAKLANCHDFISKLEYGYDTEIGERGLKLSGGQKQRIDIARSFVKNPDILLLDEATANLDSESEEKIQSSLEYLMNNRTTIVIAHRLSTIKKADKIYFLDQGKITGSGTHNFLLNNHDKYKKFVHSQELRN